jgi:hypothetical protein
MVHDIEHLISSVVEVCIYRSAGAVFSTLQNARNLQVSSPTVSMDPVERAQGLGMRASYVTIRHENKYTERAGWR